MDKKQQKRILILAVRAGEIMLKSGAEVYRVEETVERICKACRMDYVDVFAMPSGIFVTMDRNSEEDDTYTYIRRIKGSETDLTKISQVNRFSREFTSTDMTVDQGMDFLNKVEEGRKYPFYLRVLGAAVVTTCFCLLFGGSPADSAAACIIGVMCYIFSRFLEKYQINFFIRGMCCCAAASLASLLAACLIPDGNYTAIVTGCIMLFVPGVAITNSIRDFLYGDMLSGLARMTEAVITAVSLAAGAGIVLSLWNVMGGVAL